MISATWILLESCYYKHIFVYLAVEGERDLSIIVDMVNQIHHLLSKHHKELSSEDRKSLAQHLLRLGFNEDAVKVYPGLKVISLRILTGVMRIEKY